MKNNIILLNKLIDKYEELNFEQNYCMLEVKNYWIGKKSDNYFNKVNIEQKQICNNIMEIKLLISIYNYIIHQYSEFCKKNIEYDFNEFDNINNAFNDYFDIIKQIINIYNDIPLKYKYLFEEQKKHFENCISILTNMKQEFNDIYNKINNIESMVSLKLSKFNLEFIKESEFESLM